MTTVKSNTTNVDEKARRILRAVLPSLASKGLNIESRTGNFFKATSEDVIDEVTGKPVVDMDGRRVQKVRRLVVEVTNEEGAYLPEYADIADDIAAKRAAAIVKRGNEPEGLLRALAEAREKVAELDAAIVAYRDQYDNACAVVETYNLPEKPATLSETVERQAEEIEKLRALLAELQSK